MIIKEISRGIPHIEDLSTPEFVSVLSNLKEFVATEKVDGSQILFGIDHNGFYTSRETKGGERVYALEDYEISFSTTYKRSAHKLLESILPKLKEAGLRPGDQVEAEVLYGALPNVVPYSEDSSYLIFLRTTEGSVNIDHLGQKLNGLSLSIPLVSPITEDGKSIQLVESTNNWEISRVREMPVYMGHVSRKISKKLTEVKALLKEPSGIKHLSNAVIESTPLNKCPAWCEPDEWRFVKEDIRSKKEELRSRLQEGLFLEIKEILLDQMVRPFTSNYGPLGCEGGWIEGVVLRHPDSGKMVKVVDKNTFGVIREFSWKVRNGLTERARSVEDTSSFLASLQVGLASALGHPELGTRQCKRYYSQMIVESESIDITHIKEYMLSLVEIKRQELAGRLDKYEEEKSTLVLEAPPFKEMGITPSYQGAIDIRTKEAFASLFEHLEALEQNILESLTFDELIRAVASKYLGKNYEIR